MTLTADNIRAYADTLVLQCQPAGVLLDYSRASLATLEALIDGSSVDWNAPDSNTDHRNLVVFYAGCYLGETFAVLHRGAWEFAPGWQDSIVRFQSPSGDLVIAPFDIVVRRLRDGKQGNEFTKIDSEILNILRTLPIAN